MKILTPVKQNTCAIVITFHPDKEIDKRLQSLNMIVNKVLVVDNNSNSIAQANLKKLYQNGKINLIENDINLGIAAALNIGVSWAISNGYSWALLMDQDSMVKDWLIESLKDVFELYPEKELISVIAPNYLHESDEELVTDPELNTCENYFEVRTVITSGSIISLDLFQKIGPFREEFFIDHVDDDYCLRAWKKGYIVLKAKKVGMVHKLGDITVHSFLNRKYATTNHSILRRYYMSRNHTILILENLFTDFNWVRETMYQRLFQFAMICLFEKNKFSKIGAILHGIFDGIFRLNMFSVKKAREMDL
jgi:rhamnosyltransferase